MNKKFDTTFTECNSATCSLVADIVEKYRGAQVAEKLEELFASGVPANGYRPADRSSPYRFLINKTPAGVGYTYLSYALFHSNEDALDYLLRLTYKEMEQVGNGFTQYLWSQKAADALLDLGHTFQKESQDPADKFWSSIEHLGPGFLRKIAERGVNLDKPIEIKGVTMAPILKSAMQSESADLVVSLLACGIDPGTRHTRGESVLHYAVTEGETARRKVLAEPAKAYRLQAIAHAVLEAGGDVDMVDDAGRSALHLAAELGYFDKARVLLEAGANPVLKDKAGKTPEDLAKDARRRDTLRLFAVGRAKDVVMDVVAKARAASNTSSHI